MNAPEHVPPPNSAAVALLPIAEIVPSNSNPRRHFDDAYLAELAESIKSQGVIQPITVRPIDFDRMMEYNRRRKDGDDSFPKYELVVGECRWRAAKLAGLTEIPGFWRQLDDKQVLEIQVIENLQRRDVHPIEEAEGYQALIDRHGYNADQLAAKIGKSRSYIYGRLKLIALVPAVRDDCFAGKLDASTALLIARIPGKALQKKAAKEVIQGYGGEPLAYRAAKQHIHSRYTLSLVQATFKPDDATLLPAAGACSTCPKLSGNFQDLFNDIEAADVCTDPDCFDAKRQARRAQLIANAEAKKIPVLTGDEARDTFHSRDFTSLDDECMRDPERRTYREILGDKAPTPAALVERPWGQHDMIEMVPNAAMEKALRKAGITTADDEPSPKEAKRQAENTQAKQEREKRQELAEQETYRREQAWEAVWSTLHSDHQFADTNTLSRLVAEAWLRNEVAMCALSEIEHLISTHLDYRYALPDEYDDAPELERAVGILRAAPLNRALAMMFDALRSNETNVREWDLTGERLHESSPAILRGLTELLGVSFASLTHPAATPSEAAPAGGEVQPEAKPKKPELAPGLIYCHPDDPTQTWSGKGKEPAWVKALFKAGRGLDVLDKANPAPAKPANKKTGAKVPAWPFKDEQEAA